MLLSQIFIFFYREDIAWTYSYYSSNSTNESFLELELSSTSAGVISWWSIKVYQKSNLPWLAEY